MPIEKKRNHLNSASAITGPVRGFGARASVRPEQMRPITNRVRVKLWSRKIASSSIIIGLSLAKPAAMDGGWRGWSRIEILAAPGPMDQPVRRHNLVVSFGGPLDSPDGTPTR